MSEATAQPLYNSVAWNGHRSKHEMMAVDVEHSCGHVVTRKMLKQSDLEVRRFVDWAKIHSKCIDCSKAEYSSDA